MEGDMAAILEHIPLSSEEDLPRFFSLYEQKIKEGEIEDYIKKYKATKKKVRSVETELTKEQAKVKLNELADAIKNNANKRSDQFAQMMAKYGGKGALSLEYDMPAKCNKIKEKSSGAQPKKSSTSKTAKPKSKPNK